MFKYFGSKYKLAGSYPAPRHGAIIEPFAGSAGYAVLHGQGRRVVLIEKDPVVVALWHRLLALDEGEIAHLPEPVEGERCCDILVAMAAGRTTRDTPAEFIVSPRMRQRFRPMVQRIARTVARCRHFEVIAGDYSAAPDIEATWFIDPPYQAAGGRWDRTRGGRYLHSNKDIDYTSLGDWVRSRQGQVIACDQEGADWLPFDRHLAARSGTHGLYREVWWSNLPDVSKEPPFPA